MPRVKAPSADDEDVKLQGQLPGTETPRNLEIERKAKTYMSKMRTRLAANKPEKEAKDALILAMADAGLKVYEHGNLIVEIDEKRTLKVKDENSSEE